MIRRTTRSTPGRTLVPYTTLFRSTNNTAVSTFYQTFYNCNKITSIPADLFAKNTAVTTFESTFYACSSLTAVPALLFANNSLATNFRYTFYNCYKATLNPDIFCTESSARTTRFAGKTVNFTQCFRLSNTFAGTKGTAPQLWNYTASSKTGTTCFTRHSTNSLTNYSSIPASWL